MTEQLTEVVVENYLVNNGASEPGTPAPENERDVPDVRYRRVAVVGTAPSSREEANHQDEDVELWCLNDCYVFLRPETGVNRWFEMHEREIWEADGEKHVEFLRRFPNAVYMLKHHEDFPSSVQYPFEQIRDRFFPDVDLNDPSALDKLMLGSTIDYMLALAIYEDFEEIRVIGINMATQTEYVHQLPSCQYWLGIIRGMEQWCRNCGRMRQDHDVATTERFGACPSFVPRMKLYLPDSCPMLRTPIYGLSRPDSVPKETLLTRANRLYAQRKSLEDQLNAVNGAIQFAEILRSTIDAPAIPSGEQAHRQRYQMPKLQIDKAVGDVGTQKLAKEREAGEYAGD